LKLIAAAQIILLAYAMGLILLKKQFDQERPAKQRPASWVSVTVESILKSKKVNSQEPENVPLARNPEGWHEEAEKHPLWQQEAEKRPSWQQEQDEGYFAPQL
jgi:hypothetical protein